MDMEDAPVQKRGGCGADFIAFHDGRTLFDPLVGGQRLILLHRPTTNTSTLQSILRWLFIKTIQQCYSTLLLKQQQNLKLIAILIL